MNPLPEQWRIVVPAALGGLAIWMLLPREGKRNWLVGSLCGLVALVVLLGTFRPAPTDIAFDTLFYLFAGGAVISGAMMIINRNPVYSALWFAMVTLSTCGLFLLNSAPFLSAATIIVYAGAIVVTFVFVIMLAQQAGETRYDQHAYQPTLATVGAFLLLGSLLFTIDVWGGKGAPETAVAESSRFLLPPSEVAAHPYSLPQDDDLGTLRGVGRSLFTDYLYAVEMAGTVLLIATIGAIALAPRRAQGQL